MGKKFESLVAYIEKLKDDPVGEWIIDRENPGTMERPIHMPYVDYTTVVYSLMDTIQDFVDKNPDYKLTSYHDILEKHGIEWGTDSMKDADVSCMDGQGVMALLVASMRAERFCDGAMKDFVTSGCVNRWLERLKELEGK